MLEQSPIELTGQAAAFWERHYARLVERGILTDADLDTYALLCITWEKLVGLQAVAAGPDNYREMVQFVNLNKQYQSLAKQFGLMPRDRKAGKGMDDGPSQKKDEFDL